MDETSCPSILFRDAVSRLDDHGEPEHFRDLNLDQVVARILDHRESDHLGAFFHAPLHDVDTVVYRQAVCRDLEDEGVRTAIDAFAKGLVVTRRLRGQAAQSDHRYQGFRWFREAVRVYCETVIALRNELSAANPRSEALAAFRDHLVDYTSTSDFQALAEGGLTLDEEIAAVRYTVQINGTRVTVRPYEGGDDYRHEVVAAFSRFDRGEVKDHRMTYPSSGLNRVEAQILDLVAELFPAPFGRLAEYCTAHDDFIDARIALFDREVRFYLAWLDFISPMRSSGLAFCYPVVSAVGKEIRAVGAFDIALAARSRSHAGQIVPNDFHLAGAERIIVVTGPNQGGKTTFARMFGQLHYLAALGLPVPGESVHLSLPDRIFTIFDREERIETLRGKLADELLRVHDVLDQATADSVVVINEGFSSTTLLDAAYLGGEVLRRMVDRDLLGVYVTFVDELASLGEATVSMVATVDPDDPRQRTWRLVRRPADGRAYAAAIADRYGVGYQKLRERITS